MVRNVISWTVFWGVLSCLGAEVHGQNAQGRWSVLGAAEAWGDKEIPGHGIALLAWSRNLENEKGNIAFVYNTDTLRVEWDGFKLASKIHMGARVTGQLGIANLLTDYFADGIGQPERGFYASYGLAQTWLKLNPVHRVYIQLEVGGRKWFFNRTEKTSKDLQLPNESYVFEPRLYLTWWGLDGDKAWGDRFRFFPRLKGFATGVFGGVNLLGSTGAWGRLNADDDSGRANRNQPDSVQFFGVHWLKAGWQIQPWLRWQFSEESGWAIGEDDIYRRTIGGVNPYVVPIPGVPWAYFHAGDYSSFETSIPIRIKEGFEIGPSLGWVYLRDIDRVGSKDFSAVWGAGVNVDLRWNHWQVDIRGGYSPTLTERYSEGTGFSGFLAVGYGT